MIILSKEDISTRKYLIRWSVWWRVQGLHEDLVNNELRGICSAQFDIHPNMNRHTDIYDQIWNHINNIKI